MEHFLSIVRNVFPQFFVNAPVLEIGSYDVNGSVRNFFLPGLMTQRYAHLAHQTLPGAAEVVPVAIGSAIFVAWTKRETASEHVPSL